MRIALIIAMALGLAACSTEMAYNSVQGWQKQQCQQLQDLAERGRCEKSTATSYERYRAEAQAAQKPAQ